MHQIPENTRTFRADEIEVGMRLPRQRGTVIAVTTEVPIWAETLTPPWPEGFVQIRVRSDGTGFMKTPWTFMCPPNEPIEVDVVQRTPCCGATLTGTEDGPACRSCYELFPAGID